MTNLIDKRLSDNMALPKKSDCFNKRATPCQESMTAASKGTRTKSKYNLYLNLNRFYLGPFQRPVESA